MIKKYKSVNAFMLCMMVLSMLVINSCSKDDASSNKIELDSFGPTSVQHGEDISFIGKGLDKVTSIVFPTDVEVPSSQFKSQTSTLIVVPVPVESMVGKVTLKTPQGDIVTKSSFGAAYIISVKDATVEAKPGTDVTINGDYLNYVKQVTFSQGKVVTDFKSQTRTQLVVTVPMDAQTGTMTISDNAATPQLINKDLTVTLPVLTDMSPANIKQGDNLTLTGTALDLITEVDFAGNKSVMQSQFVSQSATSIVLAVPVGTINGTITLKQASPISVTSSGSLTIILPKGTNLSPSPANPGVDDITITGTNLDLVASLKLSGVTNPIPSSSFKSQTATQIVLALPASATAGGITYTTTLGYSNLLGVNVLLPGGGPPPLPLILYDESFAPGGGDWSWSQTVSDPASTEQFHSGTKSWKYSSSSGGGASEGGITAVDASSMTYFSFSLYGAPGSNGLQVACILNDNWSDYNTVTLVEGQWTEYKVQLSKYGTTDKTKIIRFALKPETSSAVTIYIDRVGFE